MAAWTNEELAEYFYDRIDESIDSALNDLVNGQITSKEQFKTALLKALTDYQKDFEKMTSSDVMNGLYTKTFK